VLGFDNFAGLPPPANEDGEFARSTVGKYKGDERILREAIHLFQLEEWVNLIVGDATGTIPEFEKAFPETLISLAYIDFDLYEPVKCALDFLSRRLAMGGIIVFDEAISRNWPGETLALLEHLHSSQRKYKMEANTLSRQPTMILIRTE
jgi:predicted O-methyltransferase YrrM